MKTSPKPAPRKTVSSNGRLNGDPFSASLQPIFSLIRRAGTVLSDRTSTLLASHSQNGRRPPQSRENNRKRTGSGQVSKRESAPGDANGVVQSPDYVQTLLWWMHRGASALSARGLPNLMPEIFETVLTMAQGRTSHRFHLAIHYGSWKKLFNMLLIEAQLTLGLTKVRGYPFEWEIDTTNICQLKCPLCHTGLDNINRMKGTMHFDTFKKTIDEIKDTVLWLSLYSWGEPLLNKQLPRFIQYARQSNIPTIISTNLSLKLTPEKVEGLIKSGLDVMIISLDGVTQEVYEKYRVRGKLDLVLENIRLIIEKKKELKSSTPFLEWQFIVMKQNEHQIPEARQMASDLGVDQIIFKRVDFPHGIGTEEMAQKWLPVKTAEFRRESPLSKPYHENGPKCWKLWRSGVINWDGGYAPCCYLTDAKHDFGNVNDNTIKEIWNNTQYRTARNMFMSGKMPQVEVGCLTCDVYLESPNGRKHSGAILQMFRGDKKEEAKVGK